MPRHSGFKSDSTPNKLFARVARAIKSLKQLQTGVRVDHISMSAEGYGPKPQGGPWWAPSLGNLTDNMP